ncbi:hypothetical protein CAOG_05380 [Capsaspora owczarzaki ATCC 30864]|uniref:Uncharacterized protein n=1 Tax=Capsaspora owczarzaki (strain ATCC 30864) TaxID=595528 RepID=A0A0D2VTY6_CAPO3|nr:hypothetical protein CAOG_05380 [Capsaspora owczarzaki ATCC 30864]KJE94802.1 hypothetical protein CAOG_005380 [Capsaspora owczarzaki ATCC 30864]|eukprot:XP_004347065.1 hypothetical protein CAOG_05380 [Capsaspora owczarzaki ATCC 30864]
MSSATSAIELVRRFGEQLQPDAVALSASLVASIQPREQHSSAAALAGQANPTNAPGSGSAQASSSSSSSFAAAPGSAASGAAFGSNAQSAASSASSAAAAAAAAAAASNTGASSSSSATSGGGGGTNAEPIDALRLLVNLLSVSAGGLTGPGRSVGNRISTKASGELIAHLFSVLSDAGQVGFAQPGRVWQLCSMALRQIDLTAVGALPIPVGFGAPIDLRRIPLILPVLLAVSSAWQLNKHIPQAVEWVCDASLSATAPRIRLSSLAMVAALSRYQLQLHYRAWWQHHQLLQLMPRQQHQLPHNQETAPPQSPIPSPGLTPSAPPGTLSASSTILDADSMDSLNDQLQELLHDPGSQSRPADSKSAPRQLFSSQRKSRPASSTVTENDIRSQDAFTVLSLQTPLFPEQQLLNVQAFSMLHAWLLCHLSSIRASADVIPTGSTASSASASGDRLDSSFKDAVVEYCLRIFDQVETRTQADRQRLGELDRADAALIEAIRILDVLGQIDPSVGPRVFPAVKRLFGRNATDFTKGPLLVVILQFLLNHADAVMFDPEPVVKALLVDVLSNAYWDQTTAFDTIDLVIRNVDALLAMQSGPQQQQQQHQPQAVSHQMPLGHSQFQHHSAQQAPSGSSGVHHISVLSRYSPNLLKLLAWNPRSFVTEGLQLIPTLLGPSTVIPLFHAILDLPLVTIALEKGKSVLAALAPPLDGPGNPLSVGAGQASMSAEGIGMAAGPHAGAMQPTPFSRAGTVGSLAFAPDNSSAGLIAPDSNLPYSNHPAFNEQATAAALAAQFPLRPIYLHLLRDEAGAGVDSTDTGFLWTGSLAGQLDKFMQTALANPSRRMLATCELVPLLLQRLFLTVLEDTPAGETTLVHRQLLQALLSRFTRLFAMGAYQHTVRHTMSELLLTLLAAHPRLIFESRTHISDFLTQRTEAYSREVFFLNLIWAIGEYASPQYDARLTTDTLVHYYEILELFAYEVNMTAAAASRNVEASSGAGFTARLMTSLMTALAKLAARCMDLAPRVLLCLAKIVKQHSGDSAKSVPPLFKSVVLKRAHELINLLHFPSIASSILSASSSRQEAHPNLSQLLLSTRHKTAFAE